MAGDQGVNNSTDEGFIDTSYGSQFFRAARHIDFLDIAEDGWAILGKSNLNSRYWTGSIWYYMNVDDAPREEKYLTGFDCKAGINDGKILSDVSQSVIFGKDDGEITVLCLTESEKEHEFLFRPEVSALEHDDMVLSLAVSADKSAVVSASSDCSIIKWKVDKLEVEHRYKYAHTQSVMSVATSIEDSNNICVSCSLDGSAILWDFRQPKPASVILDDASCSLTAVSWRNNNEVIIGTSWGTLKFLDVRNKLITSHPCYDRTIHRILPSNDRRFLAVGGDTHILKVFDVSSDSAVCVYEDTRHEDFIHGLAWHPKTQNLYSAGWDAKVLCHNSINQER
nr:PREDICTED: methylosome protein 50-like [Bemisia tabaci]